MMSDGFADLDATAHAQRAAEIFSGTDFVRRYVTFDWRKKVCIALSQDYGSYVLQWEITLATFP